MHDSPFQKTKFWPGWKKIGYYLLQVSLLTIVYHVTAHLGIFLLEEGQRGVMLFSLPSGVALAALWLFGTSLWPGIVLGLLMFKTSMGVPIILILFESVGKVLEAITGVWLLRHFQWQPTLVRVYDVLLFFIVVMMISPLLGASIANIGLWLFLSHLADPYSISKIWLVTWLSDGIGMLVITSTLLVWRKLPPFLHADLRLVEWSLLLVCLTVMSVLTLKVEQGNRLILLYMILPFAVWAAIRFEQHGATLASLLVSSVLVNGGLNRILPPTIVDINRDLTDTSPPIWQTESLHTLFLEIGFIAITASTALLVAAAYTERRQAEKHLMADKEHILTTFHSIADAVITTDAIGLVTYLNPVAERLTGWSNQQVHHKMITEVFRVKREPYDTLDNLVERCLHGVVSPYQPSILLTAEHQEKVIESSMVPIRNRHGHIEGTLIIFHDVHEERQRNVHRSTYDPVTGLYNRYEFEYQLKTLLYQIKISPAHHSLLYLHLDYLPTIDAQYGEAINESLSKQWVHFLQERVRQGDIFARLEDDRFVVLLKNCPIHHAKIVATDFIKTTQKFECQFDEQMMKVGLSIGITPIPIQHENFMQILNRAELACSAAKAQGYYQISVAEESSLVVL